MARNSNHAENKEVLESGIRTLSANRFRAEIQSQAYTVINSSDFEISAELKESQLELWKSWENLEKDNYLRGENLFRYRRYGRFHFSVGKGLTILPHAPFFQSTANNPYAGGIRREFAPLEIRTIKSLFLAEIIKTDFSLLPLSSQERKKTWELDLHQYRIIGNSNFGGEPTPEGIHNDGFDFFAVHLVKRANSNGGISTIYTNGKKPIASVTLTESMDSMIVEDPRVMHAVSPITPVDPALPAVRDVMVINFIRELR